MAHRMADRGQRRGFVERTVGGVAQCQHGGNLAFEPGGTLGTAARGAHMADACGTDGTGTITGAIELPTSGRRVRCWTIASWAT